MKHKSVQIILILWLSCLTVIATWLRFGLTRAISSFGQVLREQNVAVPNTAFHNLEQQLIFASFLPVLVLSIATLVIVLIVLARLFKDIRHATNAARYSLDRPPGVDDSLLPLDHSGETASLQAAVQDLGAKARFAIAHQKEEKFRLKDYLSDISHQLKTPLASLRLYNDLLSRGTKIDEADREQFIHAQAKQIERMDWLIQDLMTMARLDADTVEMDLQQQEMRETLALAVDPFWARAATERKHLEVRCPQRIQIPHDRNWVAEAISNVIKNALEHTSSGGEIKVNCFETPLTVQIDITDDGEGVDPKELGRLFERFYGKKTELNPDSIGIGLSLSRMILNKNEAEIYAENRAGGGMRFYIIFIKPIPSRLSK